MTLQAVPNPAPNDLDIRLAGIESRIQIIDDTVAGLADAAEAALDRAEAPANLTAAHQAIHDSGLGRSRKLLADAVDLYDNALAAKRAAYAAMRDAERRYQDTLAEVAYSLDGRFEVAGNKTYLVQGDERRAMTADERRDWKERTARQDPEVAAAALDLRKAEAEHERCVDELHLAERRCTAARIDVEAAIAHARIVTDVLRPAGRTA